MKKNMVFGWPPAALRWGAGKASQLLGLRRCGENAEKIWVNVGY